MYKHFVITRFNLQLGYKDKYGHMTLTEDWMINRFELFEKYCIPSLINQSVKNFLWLVMFDDETLVKFQEKINLYKSQIPFFIPVYLKNPINPIDIKDSVRSRLSLADKYVITTRIDNDDAIHRDFILEVQRLFNGQNNCFIQFLYGYQWNVAYCMLQKFYQLHGNHFSSRIEKVEKGVDTVITVDNTKISEVEDVEIVNIADSKKRLWIEVVHEANIANHFRVLMPRFNNTVFQSFNLNLHINKKNSINMLIKYINKSFYIDVFLDHIRKFFYHLFAYLFTKVGLFNQYKKFINLFKDYFKQTVK
jgi:hypothetical protein